MIMNVEDFLEDMKDVLQTEEDIQLSTSLDSLEEWDSLAIMSAMAYLDEKFSIKTTMEDYSKMKTIGDIAKKAGLL